MKKNKLFPVLLAIVMIVMLMPSIVFATGVDDDDTSYSDHSSVVVIKDNDNNDWYREQNAAFDKLETYWEDVVQTEPEDYDQNDTDKTVTIDSAEGLVWWAKLVNDGISFAGYTISITKDIDLSTYYWTPICANNVSNNGVTISNSGVLDNCIIDGNGYRIIGLTTQIGVREPKAGSVPGDGQNCYYYAGFIGTSNCNITMNDLTFDKASVAITQPRNKVETNGTSSIAVIVGAQTGNANLTLNRVTVTNSDVMAMQKSSAFIGNLMGGKLVVNECEISNSTFSAYFMVAPIIGYGSYKSVDINGGICLNNNTIEAIEMPNASYAVDHVTGAHYNSGYLNASTTMVTFDGSSDMGVGIELSLIAEYNGYVYTSISDAVDYLIATDPNKTGKITLLKNAEGSGIGLFNEKGHTGVDLTIDFGGNTYTMIDPAVGSVGTESQAFHLEKGNQVTLQNGTIQISEKSTEGKMLIQNYCNLTLNNLTLIGSDITSYIISCNYGDTVLNNINISGSRSGVVAIDVMHWLGTLYADKAPTMVINNTDQQIIKGIIDVYCYDSAIVNDCAQKPSLMINGGRYSADPEAYLPEYSAVTKELDTLYTVHRLTYVPAKEATCTTAGNMAYYHCEICEKNYADEACMEELADVVTPEVGHDYQDGTCTICGEKIKVEAPVIDITTPVEEVTVGVNKESIDIIFDDVAAIIENVDSDSSISEETKEALKEALTNGQEITAEVIIDAKIDPASQDKNLIENTLKDLNAQVSQYFDLTIVLKADDEVLGKVNTLSKFVSFTVVIPEDLIKTGREFYILRIHDGRVEKLKTNFNAENNTITFETDKFSTYALTYSDSTVTETPNDDEINDGSPQTDDNSSVMLWVALLVVSAFGLVKTTVFNCRKKYTNNDL